MTATENAIGSGAGECPRRLEWIVAKIERNKRPAGVVGLKLMALSMLGKLIESAKKALSAEWLQVNAADLPLTEDGGLTGWRVQSMIGGRLDSVRFAGKVASESNRVMFGGVLTTPQVEALGLLLGALVYGWKDPANADLPPALGHNLAAAYAASRIAGEVSAAVYCNPDKGIPAGVAEVLQSTLTEALAGGHGQEV